MAIPANSLRIVATGSLPSGEVWNTGFWLVPATPITSIDDLLLDMAVPQTAWNTFWAATASLRSAGTPASQLLGYYYAGGESGGKATYSGAVPLTANDGTGLPRMPDQVAIVASLRTGLAGRSFRGRMYLPINNMTLGADGQMGSATGTLICNAVGAMLDACASSSLVPNVVSATQSTQQPITLISMDTVLDTQRRRRNKIKPDATATYVMGS